MSKRLVQLLKNQEKVKVVAKAHNNQQENLVWYAALAAVLASAFYFFSFFAFTGSRALTGD